MSADAPPSSLSLPAPLLSRDTQIIVHEFMQLRAHCQARLGDNCYQALLDLLKLHERMQRQLRMGNQENAKLSDHNKRLLVQLRNFEDELTKCREENGLLVSGQAAMETQIRTLKEELAQYKGLFDKAKAELQNHALPTLAAQHQPDSSSPFDYGQHQPRQSRPEKRRSRSQQPNNSSKRGKIDFEKRAGNWSSSDELDANATRTTDGGMVTGGTTTESRLTQGGKNSAAIANTTFILRPLNPMSATPRRLAPMTPLISTPISSRPSRRPPRRSKSESRLPVPIQRSHHINMSTPASARKRRPLRFGQHQFEPHTRILGSSCAVCNGKLGAFQNIQVQKCGVCRILVHSNCASSARGPCVPAISTPTPKKIPFPLFSSPAVDHHHPLANANNTTKLITDRALLGSLVDGMSCSSSSASSCTTATNQQQQPGGQLLKRMAAPRTPRLGRPY